ncbi:hypothetical protein JF544_18745 [Halobacillus kuroshimensis]|uniref:Uncharacterized protein n=1 Tax=Halobacillus kuroshimensis TaxID=302481 RepID=A0ABS3E101_9BACI|nr:hypothetical protein [Halobacillus kuroshimensis]MBN8237288.1 hypothetical protein [Halobacillus kuroshimensis]
MQYSIESFIDKVTDKLVPIVSLFGPDFVASIIFGLLGVLISYFTLKLGKKILKKDATTKADFILGFIFLVYFSIMLGLAIAIGKENPDANYFDEVLGIILFAQSILISIDLWYKSKVKEFPLLSSVIVFFSLIVGAVIISYLFNYNAFRHSSSLVLLMYSIGTYFLGKYIEEKFER